MKKIWIDYMAPCDVFFFQSVLLEMMRDERYSFTLTSRNHAETQTLLKKAGVKTTTIGGHETSGLSSQSFSALARTVQLTLRTPRFDVSLSLANIYSIIASKLRGRQSVSIIDNDLIEYRRSKVESWAARAHAMASWIIAPKAYPVEMTVRNGACSSSIFQFDGYKEDVYVADYVPMVDFNRMIPFDKYVILRPEALYSTYVHEKLTIVPELLERFAKEQVNVVYLPRHESDLYYVNSDTVRRFIWIPPEALPGLDLVYHSRAVLTGSGTLAREASCMGQLSISFFPDKLLAVDADLVRKRKMFHSRSPEEIVDHVLTQIDKPRQLSTFHSRSAKNEFMLLLRSILDDEIHDRNN